MRFHNLDDWLRWQETLHPTAIELGLERVARVWQNLRPEGLGAFVITVAGTNGKGSCVALMEAILAEAGYRVGAYTSPHLLRYNERVRVAGCETDDESLCAAFDRVDRARGDTSLTYFEFGTLAALEVFARQRVDVALLEVGLGGRLDAVNIVDADVAVLTSIGLDHVAWLGDDREQIGFEKAGVFRAGRPAVCGDRQPPASIPRQAEQLGIALQMLGRDFEPIDCGDGRWQWRGAGHRYRDLPLPAAVGPIQLDNAATAIAALEAARARLAFDPEHVRAGLRRASLPGRFQVVDGAVERVLDVAHNPDAARALARALAERPCRGRCWAVVAMLEDKDIAAVVAALAPSVDGWFCAGLSVPRGADGRRIAEAVRALPEPVPVAEYPDVAAAYRAAAEQARPGDRLLVFGSFYTVGEILSQGV